MAVPKNHTSFFSYNISRRYPFSWFTPVAIVGGIIFTSLFTLLNFASSGYDLIVETSSDPNATVSSNSWLQHWPSFLSSKVKPTCQPAELPVNGQVFTNNTALTYKLESVWQEGGDIDSKIISPSLTYFNNVLEDCSISSIEVNLAAMDRSGNQFAYAEWGAVLRSYISCRIISAPGVVFLNLTQSYDYIPNTVSFNNIGQFLGTGFLSRNQTTQASLWWGETLMSTYWGGVTWLMEVERRNKTNYEEAGIRQGTVSFTRNESSLNIQDLNFFNADYRFISDWGQAAYDVVCCPEPGTIRSPMTAGVLAEAEMYPNIWNDIDILVKSTYSTVLTDLGQTTGPNLLHDPMLLEHFTTNVGNIRMANFKPGPANESFSAIGASAGLLGTAPSVISGRYLCQVPKLKTAGSLVVAILVANLVLLQIAWKIYKLVVETYLAKQHPAANYCQGCLKAPSTEQPDGGAESIMDSQSGVEYHPLVRR